jgi:hypothetical protein
MRTMACNAPSIMLRILPPWLSACPTSPNLGVAEQHKGAPLDGLPRAGAPIERRSLPHPRGYLRSMRAPLPPNYGQIGPQGKSRDRWLVLSICGGLLLIAGLLIAGAPHNVRSVLVPIGTFVCLAGFVCMLTGGILYITKGKASRPGIPTHQLPPPGWYPDPAGVTRWWDGRVWSSFTEPQSAGHANSPPSRPDQQ